MKSIVSPITWLIILLTSASSTLAEFTWTVVPSEIEIGKIAHLEWSGALGNVDIYLKKDASLSAERNYVYGGNDTSTYWTVYSVQQPETTYIFSAFDSGNSQFYNSEPVIVHTSSSCKRSVAAFQQPLTFETRTVTVTQTVSAYV